MTTATIRTGVQHLAGADLLCLAAAPSFGVMAAVTAGFGAGPHYAICSAMQRTAPFSGMTTMYLLMGAFHLTPWLKLLPSREKRRGCADQVRA